MKKGFTLIELLVVVLIIGILSSVALPQYRKAVLKARAAEGVTLLRSIEKAEDMYFMANGNYTLNLEALDLELPKFNCTNSYCNFKSPGGEFLWEMNCSQGPTKCIFYCAAKTAKARQVCQSFGTYSHFGGAEGWSFFVVVRKEEGNSL